MFCYCRSDDISYNQIISNNADNNNNTNTENKTMTINNAIKKLQKAGFSTQSNAGLHSAKKGLKVICFCENGGTGKITSISVRHSGDENDSQRDYFAGVYCDNISQAIRLAS